MSVGSIVKTITLGNEATTSTESWTAGNVMRTPVDLAAGKAAVLTTRTGHTEGTFTTSAAHGYTTATTFAVHWSTGVRYGMTASSASGSSIALTGGAGDNLPTQTSAVTVCSETILDFVFDGADVKLLVAHSTYAAHVAFRTVTPTVELAVTLVADIAYEWSYGDGFANPLTGDSIVTVVISNGTVYAAKFVLGVVKTATA